MKPQYQDLRERIENRRKEHIASLEKLQSEYAGLMGREDKAIASRIRRLDKDYEAKLARFDSMHDRFQESVLGPSDTELRKQASNEDMQRIVAEDFTLNGLVLELSEQQKERLLDRRWSETDYWNSGKTFTESGQDFRDLFPAVPKLYKPGSLNLEDLDSKVREKVEARLPELERVAQDYFNIHALSAQHILKMSDSLEAFRSDSRKRAGFYLIQLDTIRGKKKPGRTSRRQQLNYYRKKLENFESEDDARFLNSRGEKLLSELILEYQSVGSHMEPYKGICDPTVIDRPSSLEDPVAFLFIRNYIIQEVAPSEGNAESAEIYSAAKKFVNRHKKLCSGLEQELDVGNEVKWLRKIVMSHSISDRPLTPRQQETLVNCMENYISKVGEAAQEVKDRIFLNAEGLPQLESGTNLTAFSKRQPKEYERLLDLGFVHQFARAYDGDHLADPLAYFFKHHPDKSKYYVKKHDGKLNAQLARQGVLTKIPSR